MRPQERPWTCGPASARNILRALGTKVSENVCIGLCSTDETGTDEAGMIAAFKHFGYQVSEFQTESKQNAWAWLHGNLSNGHFVCLCVANWDHWIACIGRCGDRIIIVDPSNMEYNKSEYLTHVWSKQYLMNKWYNTRKNIEGPGRLYGISVGPKNK